MRCVQPLTEHSEYHHHYQRHHVHPTYRRFHHRFHRHRNPITSYINDSSTLPPCVSICVIGFLVSHYPGDQ